jgi:molybdenum cofactor cytidylyltransferase
MSARRSDRDATRRSAVVVVLAAGSSSRFGATKLLAPLDGRPLVAHAVRTALDAGVADVVVVTGHEGDRVGAAARAEGDVRVVHNPEHRTGQASSLVAGIRSLDEDARAAVVLLGDQPGVRADAVAAVIAAVDDGAEAARARYDEGPSHPVAFARRLWPELEQLTGDEGARGLLATHEVAEVAVCGRIPADVDEPGDLEVVAGCRDAAARATATGRGPGGPAPTLPPVVAERRRG